MSDRAQCLAGFVKGVHDGLLFLSGLLPLSLAGIAQSSGRLIGSIAALPCGNRARFTILLFVYLTAI